jgi:hypothetical protein
MSWFEWLNLGVIGGCAVVTLTLIVREWRGPRIESPPGKDPWEQWDSMG